MAKRPATGIVGVRADRIEEEPVEWAWDRWIPLGMLSTLAGKKGVGKGLITSSLAAKLTRGDLPGVLKDQPAAVAFAASEDIPPQKIITPRLEVVGAVMKRIHYFPERFTITKKNMPSLADYLEDNEIWLLVIDQLLDYLPKRLNVWSDEVRDPLLLLVDVAAKTNTAILAVQHVSLNSQDEKIMNASAFTNVPRAVLGADMRKKYHGKIRMRYCNLSGAASEPLHYRTEEVRRTKGGDMALRAIWAYDELTDKERGVPVREVLSKLDGFEPVLRRMLKGGKEVPYTKIKAKADDAGIPERTLQRMGDDFNVVRVDLPTFPRTTAWVVLEKAR